MKEGRPDRWQVTTEICVMALSVDVQPVLHVEFLAAHVGCREDCIEPVVVFRETIVETRCGGMRRSCVHLQSVELRHIHIRVCAIQCEVVEEMPA